MSFRNIRRPFAVIAVLGATMATGALIVASPASAAAQCSPPGSSGLSSNLNFYRQDAKTAYAAFNINGGHAGQGVTLSLTDGNAAASASFTLDDGGSYSADGLTLASQRAYPADDSQVSFVFTDTTNSCEMSSGNASLAGYTPPPSKPVAVDSVSPSSGVAPLPVTADASGSTDATSYAWTWGDGTSTAAQNTSSATHTYTSPSDKNGYTITLTVSGPGGSDTTTDQVVVTKPAATSSPTNTGTGTGSPTASSSPTVSGSITNPSAGGVATATDHGPAAGAPGNGSNGNGNNAGNNTAVRTHGDNAPAPKLASTGDVPESMSSWMYFAYICFALAAVITIGVAVVFFRRRQRAQHV